MWYRLELRVRADVDDDALHEIGILANTYAVVDEVMVSRDPESGEPRIIARIDAPSAEAALGALLTVISQTSGSPVTSRRSASTKPSQSLSTRG